MSTGHDGNRIHLTNWSRYALHGQLARHGWADALTIMVRPRAWEHGAGRVPLRRRELSADEYRARFERALGERLGVGLLSPGVLTDLPAGPERAAGHLFVGVIPGSVPGVDPCGHGLLPRADGGAALHAARRDERRAVGEHHDQRTPVGVLGSDIGVVQESRVVCPERPSVACHLVHRWRRGALRALPIVWGRGAGEPGVTGHVGGRQGYE